MARSREDLIRRFEDDRRYGRNWTVETWAGFSLWEIRECGRRRHSTSGRRSRAGERILSPTLGSAIIPSRFRREAEDLIRQAMEPPEAAK